MSNLGGFSGGKFWADPDNYTELGDIDSAGLMWEWLRRDPDYIRWYLTASKATRGAAAPVDWGLLFAEAPDLGAKQACIIWNADIDPAILPVEVGPARACDPDAVDLSAIAHWLTVVPGLELPEHAVISDGTRRIRLDVVGGSLGHKGPVIFRYMLSGLATAQSRILPLRRLLGLFEHKRFSRSLFPRDSKLQRVALLLRVHDALQAGALYRDIGKAIFGRANVEAEWDGPSDFLRARVRRLVSDARHMARGGYRFLMRGRDRD